MKPVFADTAYFLALYNSADDDHERAASLAKTVRSKFVTTAWVLTEFADALVAPEDRVFCADLIAELRRDPEFILIGASQELFDSGLALYRSRNDKRWSLTDCISFVVMRENEITDALTNDHHFEQAEFNALLKA